jgi:Rhodanese-like domain
MKSAGGLGSRAYKKLCQASAGLVESAGEVPMPQAIDRQDVQRLMGEGAQVVEVLPKEEFEEDHLPGAISLPLRSLETEAKDRLDPAKPVLVYCWDTA